MSTDKKKTLSEILELLKTLKSEPQVWTPPPEVAHHINEYAKAHPEKKMTKHLMRKLEREYWRSVRTEKKKNR